MSPYRLQRVRVRTLLLISICIVLAAFALVWTRLQNAANTITVNSTSDAANASDGLCTLREAITAANNNTASGVTGGECAAGSNSESDTINLSGVTGTINLTGALPNLTSSMSITGPGSSQLTVKRNTGGDYRIFTITSGTVAISGITVTNGKTPDPSQSAGTGTSSAAGGGILNGGTLTLTDVILSANRTGTGGTGIVSGGAAGGGAGISNTGNLTMVNCSVIGNTAGNGGSSVSVSGFGGPGGGISNSGSVLTLTNCVVTGNTAGKGGDGTGEALGGDGGGIYSTAGTVTLNNVTVSNNAAGDTGSSPNAGDAARGGGIAVTNSNQLLTLNNCTVNNNHSGIGPSLTGAGGGMWSASQVTIVTGTTFNGNAGRFGGGAFTNGLSRFINSTISGNTANDGAGLYIGGAFVCELTNCTVTANNADNNPNNGQGIRNGGFPFLRNTIVAGNGPSGTPDVMGADFQSRGHNLIGKNGGNGLTNGSNGDQVGTTGLPINPQLGPLTNNGGPTFTHALLSNSPALDAGDNCVAQAAHCSEANLPQLLTDQRGANFNRLVDGPDVDITATVDIGAYENQVALANLADTSTNEDTQVLVPFDVGDPSTVHSILASSSNGTLVPNTFSNLSVPVSGSTAVVTITPAANASGTSNISITVNRTVGSPESKTFLLTVNAVNDAPSFTKGSDQTVNEDAGAQTVNSWAIGISAGPADESGQALTFQVTGNTNPSLFSAGPAIDSGGTLTYTPAANANGAATITVVVQDNGGTANGGNDTSPPQTFVITVNAVNDPPSFIKGADQTVNEDSGARTVTNWATGISAGPANESGQTVTFTVTNDNNALFSSQPAVSSAGTLTYTPAANANGSATVTVTAKDNGGGSDTSPAQTFTITVSAINDPPSFTKGANQPVNEDAGAQSVTNWATGISPGPNESGQTVTFTVTNNNNALFSSQPAVSSAGTLTYTPAANANGSATVTVTAKDDGGTANGGNDTSPSQTFTITVNAVNDAPSFSKGADQTLNNNAGAQTVVNWATNISAGPSNESSQTVTFQVTGNTNPGLFTAGPAISSAGTLTYTPSSSAGGTATITINLKDNGGTANGGADTSASQTFTITVTPVGGFVNFASSNVDTTENTGSLTLSVVRTGDNSKAVSVNYATNSDTGVPCSTANGVASPKCDFTAALGTLNFAVGETSKPITLLISQDSFVEGSETITLTLSSPTGGAALGTTSTMSVTIGDDSPESPTNIIDDPNMFVRMHYHDFLNREGDQSGLNFWTGQMTNCGNSDLTVCRVNVSGAFFLSIEFQQTGYLVERMYKTGYGDATATSQIGGSHQIFVPVVRANEFLTDTQRIGRGVVVLQIGWETVLENNKQAYALEFVQTSRFITAFPTSRTPAQFVDQLNANAGNVLSPSERTTAINLFGNAADTTNVNARAQALRQVAEDQDLYNAEFNRAFVLAEYIGYLRRNPNDAPEATLDYTGYDFWLGKLNQANGDYIAAEMVKAFISSSEYRQRFGP